MVWFLKAKNWQIFLISFALPFALVLAFAVVILLGNLDPLALARILFPILIPSVLFTLAWFWAVGVGLQSKMPRNLVCRTGLFKATLLYSGLFMLTLFSSFSYDPEVFENDFESGISFFVCLILLAIVSMVYAALFVAKAINIAEKKQEVGFMSYLPDFILLNKLPLSIWSLQNRINTFAN